VRRQSGGGLKAQKWQIREKEGEVGSGRKNSIATVEIGFFWGGFFKFFCVSLRGFLEEEAKKRKSTTDRT